MLIVSAAQARFSAAYALSVLARTWNTAVFGLESGLTLGRLRQTVRNTRTSTSRANTSQNLSAKGLVL